MSRFCSNFILFRFTAEEILSSFCSNHFCFTFLLLQYLLFLLLWATQLYYTRKPFSSHLRGSFGYCQLLLNSSFNRIRSDEFARTSKHSRTYIGWTRSGSRITDIYYMTPLYATDLTFDEWKASGSMEPRGTRSRETKVVEREDCTRWGRMRTTHECIVKYMD